MTDPNKSLCQDCIHSEYPEYCWSCGLDYDNSLVEKVNSFEIPRFFQGDAIQYLLVKLAAAGGAWIGITIIGCLIWGLLGANEISSIAFFFSFFSICIIYTYGIAFSIIVDLFNRFIFKTPSLITSLIFIIFGIAFPWLVYIYDPHPNLINNPINMLYGGIAALIFFVIQQNKKRKEFIFILAIFSSVVPLIYLILIFKGMASLNM